MKNWMKECDELFKATGKRPTWEELAESLQCELKELLLYVNNQVKKNFGSSRLYAKLMDNAAIKKTKQELDGIRIK